MADKDPEREESSEPLSATAMFLRSFPTEPQQHASPEPPPVSAPAVTSPAEAGEFTRMFRPLVEPQPPSPSAAPPTPAPAPLPAPKSGDFTRAFVVPAVPPEQPSPPLTPLSKGKGYSTPGVSGSASAEGSFTKLFRASAEASPQTPTGEPLPSQPAAFDVPHPSLASPLPPPSRQKVEPDPASGVTELSRTLSPGNYPAREDAHQPTAPSTPKAYVEPTRIPRPDPTPARLPPGGGVTALLNRLTEETPLPPGAPLAPVAPPPSTLPSAQVESADTRGEFTRIIQAAELQAALAPSAAPPSAPASSVPAPAPFAPPVTVPSLAPAIPHSPLVVPAVPHLAAPVVPKLKIEAPTVAAPPKSKLQEMVPLLLVANAFLMLILIVLVAFVLHRK